TDVVQSGTAWSLVDAVTHPASFTYQARIVDAAANVGTTASQAVTSDTTAPADTLAITAIATDRGRVCDFITSDTPLTVSGTASGTVDDSITSDTTLTVTCAHGALAAGDKIQRSTARRSSWPADVVRTGTAWSLVDPTTHATSFTYQARIIDAAANVGTTASQ